MSKNKGSLKKRAKIRKKGLCPSAPFLQSSVLLFLSIQIFLFMRENMVSSVKESSFFIWSQIGSFSITPETLIFLITYTIQKTFLSVGIPLLFCFLIGFSLFLTFKALKSPKRQHLFGVSFSFYHAFFPVVLMIFFFLIFLLKSFSFIFLMKNPENISLNNILDSFFLFAQIVSWTVLVFGILDYLHGYFSFENQLEMTDEEVKEENRESMGDPILKATLKERLNLRN